MDLWRKKKGCYTGVTKKLNFLEQAKKRHPRLEFVTFTRFLLESKTRQEYFEIYSLYPIIVGNAVIHCTFTVVLLTREK